MIKFLPLVAVTESRSLCAWRPLALPGTIQATGPYDALEHDQRMQAGNLRFSMPFVDMQPKEQS